MGRIVATYFDGRAFSWEDGEVTGFRPWVEMADQTAALYGKPQPMPEAPLVNLTKLRESATELLALTTVIHHLDGRPKHEMSGGSTCQRHPHDTRLSPSSTLGLEE